MHAARVILRPTAIRSSSGAVSYGVHPAEPILSLFKTKTERGVELMLRVDSTLSGLANLGSRAVERWREEVGAMPSSSSASGAQVCPHRLKLRQPFSDLLEELKAHWGKDHSSSPKTLNVVRNLMQLRVPLSADWGSCFGRAMAGALARADGSPAWADYVRELFDICSIIWTHENEELRTAFTEEFIVPLNLMLMHSLLDRNAIRQDSPKFQQLRLVLDALCRPFPDAPNGYSERTKYFDDPRFMALLLEKASDMDAALTLDLMTLYAKKRNAAALLKALVENIHVEDLESMSPSALATYAECLEYFGETRQREMKPAVLQKLDELIKVDSAEARVAACDIMLVYRDPRLVSISDKLPSAHVARVLYSLPDIPTWAEEWGGNIETLEGIPAEFRSPLIGKLANHWLHHARKLETFEALSEYTGRHFHPESALVVAEVGRLNVRKWILSLDLELLLLNDDVHMPPVIEALCLSGCNDEQIWQMISRCVPTNPSRELSSSLYLACLAGYMDGHPKAEIPNFWSIEEERYLPELETALTHAGFKFEPAQLPDLPKALVPAYVVEDSVHVSCFDYLTLAHPVTRADRGSVGLRRKIWDTSGLIVWEFSGPQLREKVAKKDWNYITRIRDDFPSQAPGTPEAPGPMSVDDPNAVLPALPPPPLAPPPIPMMMETAAPPQRRPESIKENIARLWPTVHRGFSVIPGIDSALPALSRAHHTTQAKILLSVRDSKENGNVAGLVFSMLREKNSKILADVEEKRAGDLHAIRAINELKSWDVEFVTWCARRFNTVIPDKIPDKKVGNYFWGIMKKEWTHYPKTLARKLFPECHTLVHEIERYNSEVQRVVWKQFLARYRNTDVDPKSLLEKLLAGASMKLQKGPLKEAVEPKSQG